MINTELFKEVSTLSAKDCFILIARQKSNFNFPIHIPVSYTHLDVYKRQPEC